MQKLRGWLSGRRLLIAAGSIGLLGIGALLGVIISAAVPAIAATNGPQHSAASTPASGDLGAYCQTYLSTLESKLGVTADQLQSANQAAIKAAADQAVKDGKITQAEEDTLLQKLSANSGNLCANLGKFGGRGGFGHGPGMGGFPGGQALMQARTAVLDAVSAKLGISTSDLQTALDKGTKLTDLASQHNVSQADLNATIIATVKTQLDAAVKAGTITSDQSTQALDMVTKMVNAGHYELLALGGGPHF